MQVNVLIVSAAYTPSIYPSCSHLASDDDQHDLFLSAARLRNRNYVRPPVRHCCFMIQEVSTSDNSGTLHPTNLILFVLKVQLKKLTYISKD